MTRTPGSSPDVVTDSIRLLAERGWDATTVDQLAQAAGISRATFFRKYGSKEDIVFADHAENLRRLERLLETAGHDPQAALRDGVLLVFRHHLDHRERSLARHALLRRTPPLRERELITSYRYERVLQRYLGGALPASPDRATLATGLAAAAVAVHNAALRNWLRAPGTDPSAELAAQIERLARALTTGFDDAAPAAVPARPAVVVTVLDARADTDEILASVRAALG